MSRYDFQDGARLLPYEFDTATMRYSDIRGVIDHHDRSKSRCSPYLHALYDLRSGVILQMAWIITKVMDCYATAIGLSVEDFAARQLLQASLGGLDPVTDALRYLDSALKENPNLAEALYHKGLILVALGNHDAAISVFQAAIGLAPAIVPAAHDILFESRVLFDCGKALEARERFAEARKCYEEAVELAPDFIDAQRRYAECLRRTGEWAAAAMHDDRAMICHPVLPTLPKLPTRIARISNQKTHYPPQFRPDLDEGPRRNSGKHIEVYRGFNIVRTAGLFHAAPRGESAFDLRRAQARQYAYWYVSDARSELRSRTYWLNSVRLVEQDVYGCNILQVGKDYCAIRQREGEFSMDRFARGDYGNLLDHRRVAV